MILFDGITRALERELALRDRVRKLAASGVQPSIAAIVFSEDVGSVLYTRLKSEAAERVGIEYAPHRFSVTTPIETICAEIEWLNTDPHVTGIIVQKPWRKTWIAARTDVSHLPEIDEQNRLYDQWWKTVMSTVSVRKDVDGLHPETLAAIEAGDWQDQGMVLPATCWAVLVAMEEAAKTAQRVQPATAANVARRTAIIGRSDLLGFPLFHFLKNRGEQVDLLGIRQLQELMASGRALQDYSMIVSATGHQHLVTGDMISDGTVLIDVGEPRPDIDRASVESKAAFLTPVPGGIGPLTVVCLLENAADMVYYASSSNN